MALSKTPTEVRADWLNLRDNYLPLLQGEGLSSSALQTALSLVASSVAGGGGGTSLDQAQVKAAIESATNLDQIETLLSTINTSLNAAKYQYSVRTDKTGTNTFVDYYTRFDTSTGTVSNFTFAGGSYTPVNPQPASPASQPSIQSAYFEAITAVAGQWAVSDVLTRIQIIDPVTGTVSATVWQSKTGVTLTTTPVMGVDVDQTDRVQLALLRAIQQLITTGNVSAAAVNSNTDTLETLVDGVETSLSNLDSKATANNTSLDTLVANQARAGTPITGQALEIGGSESYGWWSSLRKAVTDLSAKLPVSLGAKLSAASLSLTLASDDPQLGTDVAGVAQSVGGAGARGWLSEMASLLRKSDPADKPLPNPATVQSALNQNLLLAPAGTGWLDLGDPINGSYRGLVFNVETTAGITAGQIVFEGTANPTLGVVYPLYRVEGTFGASTNQVTLTALTSRGFEVASPYRYVRVRISSVVIGGTVSITDLFVRREIKTPMAPIIVTPNSSVNVSQINGVTPLMGAGVSGTGSPRVAVSTDSVVGAQTVYTSTAIADVASAVITTTTNTAAFTPTWGVSQYFSVAVTAFSGTLPTLDITVQESQDGGLLWNNVYTFPTITGIGNFNSPLIALAGRQYRYVQTVGGTTPSFTRSISRYQSNVQTPAYVLATRIGGINPAASDFFVGARFVRRLFAANTTAIPLYVQYHNKAASLVLGDIPVSGEIYFLPAVSGIQAGLIVLGPTDFPVTGLTYGPNTRVAFSTTRNTYTPATMTGVNVNIEVTV
jgi:hypothetical protein